MDVVATRAHLRHPGWVKAPLFVRPRDHSGKTGRTRYLSFDDPLVKAFRTLDHLGCPVFVLLGHVVVEHVSWLDDVIIDADKDHVVHFHVIQLPNIWRIPALE